MAIISKPISLSNLLKTEFGITNSSSLTALSPYGFTGTLWGQNKSPGFVPNNIKDSAGIAITSTSYKTLSFFEECYYVVGSVLFRISASSYATSSALIATMETPTGYICGRINTSISSDVITVTSTWPSSAGTSTCTITPVIDALTASSTTTYSCKSFKLKSTSNSYNNGVFKLVGTRSFAPDQTDSYTGWFTAGSTYTVTGLLYDGYYYISVFVRNRTV